MITIDKTLPLESTTIKSPKPEAKSQIKPQVKVQGSIQKAVAETVNTQIKSMVNQVLGNKKTIQGAVETAIRRHLNDPATQGMLPTK